MTETATESYQELREQAVKTFGEGNVEQFEASVDAAAAEAEYEQGNEPPGAEEPVVSGSTEESAPDAPADEAAEQEE